jgi:hypothetical protein
MLQRIIAVLSQPQITPIVLKRPSKYPIVILRESAIRTERVAVVLGRLA